MAFALSVGAGCGGSECGSRRNADAAADSAVATEAGPEAEAGPEVEADAGADDAAAYDTCADAAVHLMVELMVRPRVEAGVNADDEVDAYDPVVFLHVSQVPAAPEGTFVVVSASDLYDKKSYARGYTRGTSLEWGDGHRQLTTAQRDVVNSADGGPLVIGDRQGAFSIAANGRVVWNNQTIGWAEVASFGAPTDAGAWLAKTTANASAVAEELISAPQDGGMLRAERWRTLFTIKDLDPLDGCHTEVRDGSAIFECERGPHPSARAHVEGGTLVVTVTQAGTTRTVERLPLPDGACVQPTGSYRQGVNPDGRRFAHVDPNVAVAGALSSVPLARSPARCADAGAASAGPTFDVHIILPRRGTTDPASLFVPALGARRQLRVSPANPWADCDARAFPRSSIAIVRCYDRFEGNGTTQDTVLLDQGELSTNATRGLPATRRATRDPESENILLPCNARVRYVIRRPPGGRPPKEW